MKLTEKFAEVNNLRHDLRMHREALRKMEVRFRGILAERCIDTKHQDVYEARASAVHTWNDLLREFDELDVNLATMEACVLAYHPEDQG